MSGSEDVDRASFEAQLAEWRAIYEACPEALRPLLLERVKRRWEDEPP